MENALNHKTAIKLLLDAVNNRTRERNYYKLLYELAEGEISDSQFEKELEQNPERYVVKTNVRPSTIEFQQAVILAKDIMDVQTSGSLETLFSFDEEYLDSECKKLLQ